MNNYFVTQGGDLNSDIQDVLFKTADFLEKNLQFTAGKDEAEKMVIYAGIVANCFAELKVKEANKKTIAFIQKLQDENLIMCSVEGSDAIRKFISELQSDAL